MKNERKKTLVCTTNHDEINKFGKARLMWKFVFDLLFFLLSETAI
jgi:hypothetical protein